MSEHQKLSVIPDEVLASKIYLIRDKKVMLDRDLADLYDVKAIRLREQVKRNTERFPENFMFQLTENEVDILVSQNAIPSRKHLGGYLPYAFTEHGILMLANVISAKTIILTCCNFVPLIIKTAIVLRNMSYNEKLEINFLGYRLVISNPSQRTIVIIAMVLVFLLIIRFFSFN